MNFSLIAFLLGRLSLALSAILLLPVGLAIFYEDGSFVEFAITSFTAFFVRYTCINKHKEQVHRFLHSNKK